MTTLTCLDIPEDLLAEKKKSEPEIPAGLEGWLEWLNTTGHVNRTGMVGSIPAVSTTKQKEGP